MWDPRQCTVSVGVGRETRGAGHWARGVVVADARGDVVRVYGDVEFRSTRENKL